LKGVTLGYSFLNKLSTAKLLNALQNLNQLFPQAEVFTQRLCPFQNIPGVTGFRARGQRLFANLPQRLPRRCQECSKTIAIIDETFADATECFEMEYNFEVISGHLDYSAFVPTAGIKNNKSGQKFFHIILILSLCIYM
jgi:hypothetical protein